MNKLKEDASISVDKVARVKFPVFSFVITHFFKIRSIGAKLGLICILISMRDYKD